MAGDSIELISPEWGAPANVHACVSTRAGGVSAGDWQSLNIATHVDDDPAAVIENRKRLVSAANLPAEPLWLNQVHSAVVLEHDEAAAGADADAAVASVPGKVCAVMTADCLPVFLCDRDGTKVAAVHAGWRGLEAGVIQNTLKHFSGPDVIAWFGPAISAVNYEVDQKIYDHFIRLAEGNADAFEFSRPGHYFFNLSMLARLILMREGVVDIYDSGLCTFDDERFYSYRRDGRTGRIASLIWMS